MIKTSYIFISIGVIILAVIVYFTFISGSKEKDSLHENQTNQQTSNQSVTESLPPAFVEAIFEYYKDMEMDPKIVRLEEGQKVVIKVTADVTDKAHLHGYDISAEVKPGQQTQLIFTANRTGRFPIELEELKKDIGVIEVYPK